MNERIRELAVETDAWCDQNYTGEAQYRIRWERKFAELIVEECLSIVGTGGEFCSRPKLVEKIKEHFGVNE
jgi:hypothetical protein